MRQLADTGLHTASPAGSDRLFQDISRCVKCGSCRSVCPSFLLTRQESFSPRGRMALVKAVCDGRLPVTEIFKDRLETCTSCLACESVCASSVPVTKIIQAAREMAVERTGTGIVRSLLGAALKNEQAMKVSAWLAPLALHYEQRSMRPAPRKDRTPPESRPPAGGNREKLLFFPGCSITYYQPGLGEDAALVLDRLGYEVIVPEGLACCGRPLLSLGDRSGAEEAARRNASLLEAFGQVPLVTACASCALTFKKEYATLLAPQGALPPVFDIHQVIAGRLDRLGLSLSPRTITWHDPCHLGRGLGLSTTAREVLRAVSGVTLLEMKDPDRCCGFGGVMRVTHRGISEGILAEKVRNIRSTGAQTVVTGCPSCRTQVLDGLRRTGSTMDAVHTVELLAQAIGDCDARREGISSPVLPVTDRRRA